MKEVIEREIAEELAQSWADELDSSVTVSEKVIKAVMRGRLDFQKGSFNYILLTPVELQNGETLTAVEIAEPTVEQLRESSKHKGDEMETTIRIISALTDKPIGVIGRIKMRDITLIGELLGFFG